MQGFENSHSVMVVKSLKMRVFVDFMSDDIHMPLNDKLASAYKYGPTLQSGMILIPDKLLSGRACYEDCPGALFILVL